MTQLVAVYRNPNGYRVKVLNQRIHHGLIGVALVFYGAWLVGKDIADFPWLSDYT